MPTFTPTRDAGLARLEAISPRLGRHYAANRNTDPGPGASPTTAALSPWLRRRMVLEEEAVRVAHEGQAEAGEKFVQEVLWRTYFKGHLETRPQIWGDYTARLAAAQARLEHEPGLRRAYDQAVAGRTGIDAFDAWAQELQAEHWLHNHTRMWFASIWIFSLGLPWTLGADLFLRHLVDGDPASNTLSWRWVAGLHTRGKTYAARAENIARYTEGRFHPRGLNEHPEPLDEPDLGAARPLPRADAAPEGDVALLLHLDDLHPESLPLGRARVARVVALQASVPDADPAVAAFDAASLADAVARAQAHFGCPAAEMSPGWNDGLPIVTAWAPVGPSARALPPAHRIRRVWDDTVWPRSTAGYFKVKATIPALLATL